MCDSCVTKSKLTCAVWWQIQSLIGCKTGKYIRQSLHVPLWCGDNDYV